MGEVYRARDSRLKREVALKILPAEFAKDSSRRGRFEQEAHAAAALNHPNIVALFDIGEHDGIAYIVTELVSGETLSSVIERGPINIRKLLDIAVQIADGMAAAHAAHITHRDLKPANIMAASDGRAKILDFGLARQAAAAVGATAETMTQHTQPGMIVGTASYMSPEQARGGPIDFRSDQFSFGLILYEMVTGRRAFQRPESVQTLSAILTEEPPPIDRSVPAPLHWVIDRCLNKDPGDRYESTRDLFQELRNLRDHLSDASASNAAPGTVSRGSKRWLFAAVAAFCVLLGFGAGHFFSTATFVDQAVYRFTPFGFDPAGQLHGSWSPDGKAVAYVGRAGGKDQVFIRYLDAAAPVRVTRTSENSYPFAWTPDGQRILFWSAQKPEGVWSVAAAAGEPEPLLALDKDDQRFTLTSSPDFKTIALLHKGDDGRFGVWVSSPPGSPLKKYSPDPFATRDVYNDPFLRFSPDGKRLLLFLAGEHDQEQGWLLPYPQDASRPPKRVLADLPIFGGTPWFGWMPDSRHIVLSTQASATALSQLWLADTATGRYQALTSGTINRSAPSVSPDGKKILFTEDTSNFDVVSVNLETAIGQRLVATERNEQMPDWAARQWVMAYVTDRNGPMEIWLRAGEVDRPLVTAKDLPPGTVSLIGPAMSPDALRVIYERLDLKGNARLWISAASGGTPSRLTNVETDEESSGSWSPDGTWFTYLASRAGKNDLMKVKTTGQATPTLAKAAVNSQFAFPAWSPDGNWIALQKELVSPDGKATRPLPNTNSLAYVFSADGKRVYGIRREGERLLLFSVDLATEKEKVIGDLGNDFRPAAMFDPGVRFSLAPDGKSFVYGTSNDRYNLWLLEGFEPKTDLLTRLGLR
jgi:Tol biopolymer transport system component